MLLLASAWIVYRLARRGLGHQWFRGRWHSAAEYDQLMQLLHEDHLNNRVLPHEELVALRKYKYGNSVKAVRDARYGGYDA